MDHRRRQADAARHATGLLRFGAVGVFNVATEFTLFGLLIAAGVSLGAGFLIATLIRR